MRIKDGDGLLSSVSSSGQLLINLWAFAKPKENKKVRNKTMIFHPWEISYCNKRCSLDHPYLNRWSYILCSGGKHRTNPKVLKLLASFSARTTWDLFSYGKCLFSLKSPPLLESCPCLLASVVTLSFPHLHFLFAFKVVSA